MASEKQLVIERILRDRAGIWEQIIAERDLPKLIGRMLLTSVISLAAYGAGLGASNGWLQSLVSTVKLPLLFLATLAICLPTLYLFNLVFRCATVGPAGLRTDHGRDHGDRRVDLRIRANQFVLPDHRPQLRVLQAAQRR